MFVIVRGRDICNKLVFMCLFFDILYFTVPEGTPAISLAFLCYTNISIRCQDIKKDIPSSLLGEVCLFLCTYSAKQKYYLFITSSQGRAF